MKFQLDDVIVNTDNAIETWEENTVWNGRNHISVATGDQWIHQTLYKSKKGRYYVVTTSQWQGSLPNAEWLTPEEAARWILNNSGELPSDLGEYEESIVE